MSDKRDRNFVCTYSFMKFYDHDKELKYETKEDAFSGGVLMVMELLVDPPDKQDVHKAFKRFSEILKDRMTTTDRTRLEEMLDAARRAGLPDSNESDKALS